MNIPSVKADGIVLPASSKPAPAKASPTPTGEDVFKPEQNEKLLGAIHAEPAVRPEVVARARALLTDSKYPGNDVIDGVARELLRQFR